MEEIEKYLNKLVYNTRDDKINFDLAYAYDINGQYAAANSYYLRCAEFTENNILASECLLRCSFLMNKQGGRDQKEIHYIRQSISASPCSLEPYYIASLYHSWRNNNQEAYLYACLGINIYENNIQSEKFNKDINFNVYDLYFQKAITGLNIGRLNETRYIYTKLLQEFTLPDYFVKNIFEIFKNIPQPNHQFQYYNIEKSDKLKYLFENYKEIHNNFSQIYQDMFVLSMTNGKENGTYLEISSGDYKFGNNTFLLENKFNWYGISIDIKYEKTIEFNNNRKNKSICTDASKIDYKQLLSDYFKCTNIDYLQLDCDPPNTTFEILKKIPFDIYKFGVITYEHDYYNDPSGKYRNESRNFLNKQGYKLICGNISAMKNKYPFEDWWIHPDIINKKIYKLFERENDDPINGEKYMLTKSKIAEDPIGLKLIIEEQVDTIKENDMLNTLKYENNIYELKNYHNKNSAFFKLYKNCPISDCVKRGHKWEEHQHNIIDKYVKDSYYCVEVGCHIGTISVKLSKSCKKLYCFEPLINSFNLLKENLELNNCNNVIIHNKGLSNENKQGYLDFISPNNPGGTGILCDSQNINSNVINLTNKYPIELITLDSFNIDKLDYLKIDVEGYENNVINGAFKTIKKCKPLIVMEIFENMNTYSDGQPVIPMSVEKVKDRYKNIIDLGYNVINIDQHDYLFIPDKLVNNLNNFPNVLILSIPENKTRQQDLIEDCKKYNLNYEIFECKKYPDCNSKYTSNYCFDWPHNVGVTCGYIKMLKYWYDNYTEDYAFFCEDDIDFTISDKWGFTWDDFMNELDSKWSIVQTVIISAYPSNLDFNLSNKEQQEWSITGNLIKRDYCKYLLDQHYIDDTNYNLSIQDYEKVAIPLVPEDLVYRQGFLHNSNFYYPLSKPLFIEKNKFQKDGLHINSNSYIENYYKMRNNSISQLYQDINVIEFFNKKENLFFVDIGAYDGITISNTYLLEKQYKWSGICSEPLPEAFKQLINYRDAQCDNNAVLDKTGLTFDFSESGLLSGITKYIDKYIHVKECKKSKANTITLQDLLKKYKSSNIIHYLSLDTQGSELEILQSVNYSQYTFLYITLEHNYIEPKRSLMREILLSNGYLYKGENKWDDEYIHESNILGTFYYDKKYETPITIKKIDKNVFSVSSNYWKDDIATFHNGSLYFENFGKANVFYTHIDFGQYIGKHNIEGFQDNTYKYGWGNVWHRDDRKNILFIGSNNMDEIINYTSTYNNGIFIEAIPNIYEQLKDNLNYINNTYNTNYIAVNQLVTDKIGEEYQFNIFSNNGLSSSIFEPNIDKWRELHPEWNHVDKTHHITLISNTIENIIQKYGWENKTYDVVLDVQGAELVVLKGFGKDNIKNIDKLHVEISKEEFYDGGVLFPELNDYIINCGFKLISNPISDHCDVTYVRNNNYNIKYVENNQLEPFTLITSIN